MEARARTGLHSLTPHLSQANCAVSAAFVLLMRKRIKLTGFTDWETLRYNNLLSVPVLAFFSFALEDWTHESLVRNLYVCRSVALELETRT